MLDVDSLSFAGNHQELIPATSFHAAEGRLTLVQAPTDLARTALSLLLSGRMNPSDGTVLVDGAEDAKLLRHGTALVDSPRITEPEHHMKLKHVVAESLALRPRPRGANPLRHMLPGRGTSAWISEHGLDDYANEHFSTLDPALRIDVLLHLAFADPQVRFAVVDSPDRHDLSISELLAVLHSHTRHAGTRRSTTGDHPRGVVAVLAHLPADEDLPEDTELAWAGLNGSGTDGAVLEGAEYDGAELDDGVLEDTDITQVLPAAAEPTETAAAEPLAAPQSPSAETPATAAPVTASPEAASAEESSTEANSAESPALSTEPLAADPDDHEPPHDHGQENQRP